MIQIQTLHVHFTESEDAFGIAEAIVNQAIDGVAEALENEVRDVKCEEHPNQTSIIEVSGSTGGMVSMEMIKFCCLDFKNSVKLNVN